MCSRSIKKTKILFVRENTNVWATSVHTRLTFLGTTRDSRQGAVACCVPQISCPAGGAAPTASRNGGLERTLPKAAHKLRSPLNVIKFISSLVICFFNLHPSSSSLQCVHEERWGKHALFPFAVLSSTKSQQRPREQRCDATWWRTEARGIFSNLTQIILTSSSRSRNYNFICWVLAVCWYILLPFQSLCACNLLAWPATPKYLLGAQAQLSYPQANANLVRVLDIYSYRGQLENK